MKASPHRGGSISLEPLKVQLSVVNGLDASSNTMSVKPHEFFDHTPGVECRLERRDQLLKLVERQAGEIQELYRSRLQLSKP